MAKHTEMCANIQKLSGESLMYPLFISDFFQQLFQGNPVAYLSLFLGVGFVIVLCALAVGYWKLPQLARSQLWNNILGHNPTIATCYPDLTVKFNNPKLFSNGICYDGNWQILLRDDGKGALTVDERATVNNVYRIEGTNSPMFLRFSKYAYAVSPEFAAAAQNLKGLKGLHEASKLTPEQFIRQMSTADSKHSIKVPRKAFIESLKQCKDEFIQIAPMYFSFDVNMPKIIEMLPNFLSDTNLKEHENLVKNSLSDQLNKGTLLVIVLIVAGVGSLLGLLNFLKQMGVI